MKTSITQSILALASLTTAAELRYDYVIVGGGTAGLVIANRLSEVSNITVAVIEAGGSVLNNPNVTDPLGFIRAFGTDIDWSYSTVPQKFGGNQSLAMHGGKALGGTSTINGKQA
jgi:choline dehydrogenase-like flavoprotein